MQHKAIRLSGCTRTRRRTPRWRAAVVLPHVTRTYLYTACTPCAAQLAALPSEVSANWGQKNTFTPHRLRSEQASIGRKTGPSSVLVLRTIECLRALIDGNIHDLNAFIIASYPPRCPRPQPSPPGGSGDRSHSANSGDRGQGGGAGPGRGWRLAASRPRVGAAGRARARHGRLRKARSRTNPDSGALSWWTGVSAGR